MRFLFVSGNILVLGGLLVSAISGVALTNEMLQKHPLGFLAFWAFIPMVSWWLTWEPPAGQMSSEQFPAADKRPKRYTSHYTALKTFTSFLVGSAFLLSFLILLNWERMRDAVGGRYVQGYFAMHDVVYAEHWYAQRAMNLFEFILVAGAFGFPFLTLTLTLRMFESHRWKDDD